MNRSARRLRAEIGLAYLSEIIADVLHEAHEKGDSKLLVRAITELAGFGYNPLINQVVTGTLNLMKQDGLVCETKDVEGHEMWFLLDV